MLDFGAFAAATPHPGEFLREEYLPAYKLTAGSLAKAMGLKDRTRVERIIRERQPVTADSALRLAKVFGTSPEMWLNLQVLHDLSKAAIEAKGDLDDIKTLEPAAS
jgi:addiction module HigA family antidote